MDLKRIVKEFFELDTNNVDDILDYFSYKYNKDREAVELGFYIGRLCAIVDYVLPVQKKHYLDLSKLMSDVENIVKLIKEVRK